MLERSLLTAVLLCVSLLTVTAVGTPAGAHLKICSSDSTDYEILVMSPVHPVGSISEYGVLTVMRGTALAQYNQTVNQIDSYVKDLHCQADSNDSYTVTANGATQFYEVRVRLYDHFGAELDETNCAQGHSGSLEDRTQYIVVIACQGTPLSTADPSLVIPAPHPVTIRGSVTFTDN